MLNSVKDGAKYLLINLAASGVVKAVRAIKNTIWAPGEESRSVRLSEWRIIEDYSAMQRLQEANSAATLPKKPAMLPTVPQVSIEHRRPPSSGSAGAPMIASVVHDASSPPISFQVVECPTEEMNRMISSMKQGGMSNVRTINADAFASTLEQSVRDLNSRSGHFSESDTKYPELPELQDSPDIEHLLASSMNLSESRTTNPTNLDDVAAPARSPPQELEPLLTSWIELPPVTQGAVPSAPPLNPDDFEVLPPPEEHLLDELLADDSASAPPLYDSTLLQSQPEPFDPRKQSFLNGPV